jgi:Skp family chaperone for outer membrane proteins
MRAVLSAALVLGLITPCAAMAQETPPAAPLGGVAIPGLCMLSTPAIAAHAKVGEAATARLQELQRQAQTEVNNERGAIESDAKAVQAQKATLKPGEYEAKERALQTRLNALQAKANGRSQQWEITRQKALARISVEAQPVIASVYKAHGCGLLVDRNSVLGGNMANDLTLAVVQGLDAKITTISFDLEPLPAPGPVAH